MVRRLFSDRELRFLFLAFCLTRFLLALAGIAGRDLLPPGKAILGRNLRVSVGRSGPCHLLRPEEERNSGILDIWARWDSEWYLLIAQNGYDSGLPGGPDSGFKPGDTTGFFPLYPFLISIIRPLSGAVGAGVLISHTCLLLSLILLLGLSRRLWGEAEGSRIGLGAGMGLLFFPMSLFHSAVYSESLFLMLSTGSILAAETNNTFAAIGGAALSVLTRPFGFLLGLPLAARWWSRRNQASRLWLALPAMLISLGLYMLYCFGVFGDALAFVHRQARWRGASVFPGYAFLRCFKEGPALHGGATSSLELIMAILLIALLPLAFRRLPRSFALYFLAGIALPLSSSLWSFSRIASNLFPLYLLIGIIASDRPRLGRLIFFLSGIFSLVAMTFFGAGWWVG